MATAPISGWVVPARKEARGLSGGWGVPLGGGFAVEMEDSGATGRGGCWGQHQEGRGRLCQLAVRREGRAPSLISTTSLSISSEPRRGAGLTATPLLHGPTDNTQRNSGTLCPERSCLNGA